MLKLIKKRAVSKAVRGSHLRPVPVGFDFVVNTVGVVLDRHSVKDVVGLKQQLLALGIDGGNLSLLCCAEQKGVSQEDDVIYLSYRDFDIQGQMKSELGAAFIDKSFDLLIVYSTKLDELVQWVTVKSQASFKVGVLSASTNLHHLEIDAALLGKENYMNSLFEYIEKFKR